MASIRANGQELHSTQENITILLLGTDDLLGKLDKMVVVNLWQNTLGYSKLEFNNNWLFLCTNV